MKPIKSYRLAIAARYWKAAHLILTGQTRSVEYMEPVGHLLSMSAEIALKSYLSGCDYSDKKLKDKIGHDLEKCMWQAIREGLVVEDSDVSCVLTMRSTHLNNLYRYGMPAKGDGGVETGIVMLFDENLTLSQVAKLIDRISGSGTLLRNMQDHSKWSEWPATEPVFCAVDLKRFDLIKAQVQQKKHKIEVLNQEIRERR